MPETHDVLRPPLAPAQAVELALLIDLEARWENLRAPRSCTTEGLSAAGNLQAMQRAYDAFRARLRAYNRRYAPEHVSERLLNTPGRLGKWCREARDLYRLAEHDRRVGCPVHLLEKAYRHADWLAAKAGERAAGRSEPPVTIPAALRDLEALAAWCDGLATAS
jgi:hypothetical protein